MILLYIVFVLSALFLPWWVVVPLGILAATHPTGAAVTVLTGAVLDVTFGAPLHTFFEFQYFYTALFLFVAGLVFILRSRVID